MKALKITGIIIGALILITLGLSGLSAYKANDELNPDLNTKDLELRIDKTFDKAIEKGHSSGIAIALYKNDTVLIKTYGLKDKQSGEEIDTNTIFEIGSISKVFTTSLLQMSADAGHLKLEDDIRQYLPDSIKYGFEHTISLEQLSTHTSGLPRLPTRWFEDSLVVDNCNPYTHLNFDSIVTYLENPTEMGTQGEVAYSNLGNGLIGHILERVHNKSLNELLDSMIFIPLNMSHSGIETDSSLKHLVANGYDKTGKATCNWQLPILGGAGAIESNIPDMLQFLKANLNEDHELYSSSKCHEKRLSNLMGNQGLGWQVGLDIISNFIFFNSGENFRWHNGATGGFRSAIVLDKKSNNGIIVLSSGENDISTDAIKLLNYANNISLK
jgi:CubicO group peptidase (beta-lactamase class C family)